MSNYEQSPTDMIINTMVELHDHLAVVSSSENPFHVITCSINHTKIRDDIEERESISVERSSSVSNPLLTNLKYSGEYDKHLIERLLKPLLLTLSLATIGYRGPNDVSVHITSGDLPVGGWLRVDHSERQMGILINLTGLCNVLKQKQANIQNFSVLDYLSDEFLSGINGGHFNQSFGEAKNRVRLTFFTSRQLETSPLSARVN